MSEPGDQKTYHPKTSLAPSGGSAAILEHPSPNENGGLEDVDRGRYRDGKQPDGSSNTMTENLWQMQGGQQEVCPGFVAGNSHPKCPTAAQPCQESGTDVAGEGGHAARGNSGDGPCEETLSQVQGESGRHIKRQVSGCARGGPQSGPDVRLGKKKHRRRPSSKKKRRWKPYFKLTWEEKKEFDERETARASRVRAEMFAKGLPVAPYNTTQFLMEEHDREEPDLNTELVGRRVMGASRTEDTASEEDYFDFEEEDEDGSGGGSDGIGRPGNAGGEFLQRDFSETYEKYHVESLQNMTKQELVREYLELEKCMSRLEEENNRLRRSENRPDVACVSPVIQSDASRLRELESELERLKAQNSELRLQNQLCRERGQTLSMESNSGQTLPE
ncbi:protein HEXIM1-like [Megalops cyprinoides]|uniref:protein HEXIM1-like n=1 Tax=Megalops cyprinoides TaxID=118141 RepID=UPI00186432B2|nr:protein HEXIM1-like [Megalops cyprinoides]